MSGTTFEVEEIRDTSNELTLKWARPPLGEEIETFIGKKSHGEGWTRALANWNALQAEVCDGRSRFMHTLSTSQRNSLRLLVEWWTGQYTKPEVAAVFRQAIYTEAAGNEFVKGLADGIPEKIPLEDYNRSLFQLFGHEFLDTGKDLIEVQNQRNFAARAAACQRIAFEVFRHQAPEVLASQRLANDFYRSQGKQSSEDSFDELTKYSTQSDSGLPVGGTMEACPWLPTAKRKGLPHYLWDIAERRTVIVQELQNSPVYVVISHTWGRWKIADAPYVSVPRLPWPLPRNTRFDIEDLPEVFAKNADLFAPAKYVWFDLFCIPQDRSPLAKQEIANQAAIFRGAYRAVAWLNYVSSWDGLSSAVQYLASFYLDTETVDSVPIGNFIRCALKRTFVENDRLWKKFSFDEDYTAPRFYEYDGSGGWFTSLWTLQELYLRPDMLLCNRNWELFKTPSGVPTTLDAILALDWGARPRIVASECNKAVVDLITLLGCSGLDAVLEPHPISPLSIGSRRQCTERRAEAIMSVVGATSWYQSTKDLEVDLVMDQYPIEFLREVHHLTGGSFFRSWSQLSCYPDILKSRDNDMVELVVAGTMLPFDSVRHDSKYVTSYQRGNMNDHSSVATWSIANDGKVLMLEVGIVASTEAELDEGTNQELLADVVLPIQGGAECFAEEDMNLHTLMRERFPSFMKHAICIQEGEQGLCEGVILMEVKVKENDDAPMRYAKIGDFFVKLPGQLIDIQTWDIEEWEVF